MPQLGETVAEGKISKWFVKAGDSIQPGQNLFEIETDKVSMEVPAISAGVLAAIHVPAGETAPVGAIVAVIQGSGETISLTKPQSPLMPAKSGIQSPEEKELVSRFRGNERSTGSTPAAVQQMEPFREVRSPERNYGPARLAGGTVVTPLARRLASEAGIDLANIKGSGPRGRIIALDVTAQSDRTGAVATPTSNIAALSRASGAVGAQSIIALTADVQIGNALALCADVPALQLTDVIVKAWATALQRVTPAEPSAIVLAIGTDRSIIHNAAGASLTAIAAARREPASDAPQLSSAISIPGLPGIVSVTDVLRPPHTTMLSIGAPRRAPVEAPDGAVRFSDMMTATLACDAQAIDAARGAELLSAFKGYVERPVTMIV